MSGPTSSAPIGIFSFIGENLCPNPSEPWRLNVREVTATPLECRDALAKAGIEHTCSDLIEMARLSLAREWGWPRRERAAPSD
jgi:hypothetical protein